jgi:signal transduction histidine kinase
MEVWTIWHGTYRLAGIIKLITALLSISTAVALVPLMPKALALSSPARLATVIGELQQEMRGREQAEADQRRSLEQLRALAARLQTVREEERTRVAREIHDALGQSLTAIKMELAILFRDQPVPLERESVLKLIDGAIQSVRRISTELRPGILDDLGLVAAVEWTAEEFEARTGIECYVSLPEADLEMDGEHATALFRILQEALTNVARHAKATQVIVRLSEEEGDLSLEVRDNGRGIPEEQFASGRSLGILGMRERALLLGGGVTINSAPGTGTSVRVRIPEVHRKQARADS